MTFLKLLLIGLIGLCSVIDIATAEMVNCYYGVWSSYRPGDGKLELSNINPNFCTHVSFSFFGITQAGEFKILEKFLDTNSALEYFAQKIALNSKNKNLKILAVVGGWEEDSTKYSTMASDANKRKVFIQSALESIKKYGFNGLILDWEYPGQCGGCAQDKDNFVTLLKEIKEAFESHTRNLELGISVGASAELADTSYDIVNLSKYVDFIDVMAYNFAGARDGKLGFNAPLRGQGKNNVESSIKHWLKEGALASKLNLGLAFYGSSFTLANSEQTTAGSPIAGPGKAGPYTGKDGYMGYNEICSLNKTWKNEWSSENDVPYIYNLSQWVSYDNQESIELKVEFAIAQNLRGVMIHSIETDDFRGECGPKFTLLTAVNNKLGIFEVVSEEEKPDDPFINEFYIRPIWE